MMLPAAVTTTLAAHLKRGRKHETASRRCA